MRPVLRLLGTRYGIALLLTLVVLVVVGVARSFFEAGAAQRNQVGPELPPVSTPAAADASQGDDSVAQPSDAPTARPSLSAGAPDPATVATRFVTAWLKHTGVTGDQWRAALTPNATPALMAKLAQTDPAGVPASQVVGEVRVVTHDAVAEALVPVNGGTVTLTLVVRDGRWKVDGIDWGPT
jgi:hypothetical protein